MSLAQRGVLRDRCRSGPGLYRQALGADAATAGHCRVHYQDTRDLHEVWPAGKLYATHI